MYKNVRKYFVVAVIAVSLSTPSLAQVINPACSPACYSALQRCLASARNPFSRAFCTEDYLTCIEGCGQAAEF